MRSDAPKLAVDPVDVSSPGSAPRKTADTESRKLEVVTSNGPAALPEMTAIFSAAEQLGEVGRGQIRGGSGGGGGIESAYDAFQLPMIPEPAAGPGIVVLLAAVTSQRALSASDGECRQISRRSRRAFARNGSSLCSRARA